MNITKWEPFNADLFSDFSFAPIRKFGLDFATDLYMKGENAIVKMAIPGIEEKNLTVSVNDDMLNVTGAREEEKEVSKDEYYYKEINRGSFSRSVLLPGEVDTTRTEARYKDGILSIVLPMTKVKLEESVPIEVVHE